MRKKWVNPPFRAKRGISPRRKPKKREIPHFADSVRNDGIILFPQAVRYIHHSCILRWHSNFICSEPADLHGASGTRAAIQGDEKRAFSQNECVARPGWRAEQFRDGLRSGPGFQELRFCLYPCGTGVQAGKADPSPRKTAGIRDDIDAGSGSENRMSTEPQFLITRFPGPA